MTTALRYGVMWFGNGPSHSFAGQIGQLTLSLAEEMALPVRAPFPPEAVSVSLKK